MTPEQAAAYINAQSTMMRCRIEAMVAENQQRAMSDCSPGYGEDAFLALEREFAGVLGHNAIITLYQDATP